MKLPANPLTPPEKLIDCLPFSFTFSLISTVPAFTLRFRSAFSGLIGSKYPSWLSRRMLSSHKPVVEYLALVQQQLAADHFVARRRVAGKFDPPHEELLLLVELQRHVDDFLRVVDVEQRLGGEIDISVLAVQFPVIVERLADLVGVEKISPSFSGKTRCEDIPA